jgi:adenylate cyclase
MQEVKTLKVLIVDDEPDMETLIRQKYRKRIHDGELEFVFASHGEQALECLKNDPTLHVVMTDIRMPVMDGLTLLSHLPSIGRTLKAVIISAFGDIQNIRTAMNHGAYDFLTKPIDFRDFDVTLQKTFSEIEALEKGSQAREHLIATLNVVSDLSSELQLGPLLQKIIATITRMLRAERSTLFLYDEKKKELYTEVGEGLGKTEIRIPAETGIAGMVFTTSNVIRIADAYSDPRFNPEVDHATGFSTRSILCVPVVNKQGHTIGVTQVLNKIGGSFTEDDEARLRAFTTQISIALENAKMFNEVQTIKNYNENMLESMASGVITLDEDGTIVTCNAAGRRIMKVRDEIVGTKAADFLGGPNNWLLERLRDLDGSKAYDVAMDAEMEFGGDKISANVTILPLAAPGKKGSGLMIMIEDITRERRLKSTMSRYMDPSVVEKVLEYKQNVLGGQSSLATVLFSDIRNFTSLTEKLGPADTVTLLNEFFTVMVDCIHGEGGMLDKFIGDACMAEFGIPLPHEDDEDRAVRAAISMHRELHKFNRTRSALDRPPIRIGIGINTDFVVSGNIGSPKRMDYTVIGDGANLASRLESACKEYGTAILVSERTFTKLRGEYHAREVDQVVFQGKSSPSRVFEILDHHTPETFPNMAAVVKSFSDGLYLYRHRKWDEAISAFQNALHLNPTDLTSAMYVKRCQYFKNNAPAESWGGVWVMTSK